MKYGPIICDPNSEEAKKLIGKKVVASDSYTRLSNLQSGCVFELAGIDTDGICPFRDGRTELSMGYSFIREVIEEPPQYRPYKDTKEMVEDFKERFCKHTTSPVEMPLIWLTPRGGGKHLVTDFSCSGELIKCMDGYEGLDVVFDLYTYLDGSPVGKEVKE